MSAPAGLPVSRGAPTAGVGTGEKQKVTLVCGEEPRARIAGQQETGMSLG